MGNPVGVKMGNGKTKGPVEPAGRYNVKYGNCDRGGKTVKTGQNGKTGSGPAMALIWRNGKRVRGYKMANGKMGKTSSGR